MRCGVYLTPTGNIYEVVGDSKWGGKTLRYRKCHHPQHYILYRNWFTNFIRWM
jgi:hypothetical protein